MAKSHLKNEIPKAKFSLMDQGILINGQLLTPQSFNCLYSVNLKKLKDKIETVSNGFKFKPNELADLFAHIQKKPNENRVGYSPFDGEEKNFLIHLMENGNISFFYFDFDFLSFFVIIPFFIKKNNKYINKYLL